MIPASVTEMLVMPRGMYFFFNAPEVVKGSKDFPT